MSLKLSALVLFVVAIVVVNSLSLKKRAAATCAPGQFTCRNGVCLKNAYVCDTEDDCGDNSDEAGCPTDCSGNHQFKCANNRCIPHEFWCDGDDDCGDKSDEAHCPH
ncbi:very low-density lipoprotein receptor [Biomphalaria glabrata]|nr:very low-density lipoprotein receptor [Biomphalaria glabrata]